MRKLFDIKLVMEMHAVILRLILYLLKWSTQKHQTPVAGS